jgi:short-subunit dehydrogenase
MGFGRCPHAEQTGGAPFQSGGTLAALAGSIRDGDGGWRVAGECPGGIVWRSIAHRVETSTRPHSGRFPRFRKENDMNPVQASKGLALVTGASTGIGYELAKRAAQDGYDLVIAADEAQIERAATSLKEFGVEVQAIQVDLATTDGVQRLASAVRSLGRPVDLLLANAGRGLGEGFLDENLDAALRVVNTNVSGTISLVHAIGNDMRRRGEGRILLTGSIAGFMPGSFQAVYNATKAFINSFSFALRDELKGTGVSVTCLMPGPTDTEFFERAELQNTPVGQMKKDDPVMVAKLGYEAMMDGEGDVVTGWKNKLQSALANVTPAGALAAAHRKMAEPNDHKH